MALLPEEDPAALIQKSDDSFGNEDSRQSVASDNLDAWKLDFNTFAAAKKGAGTEQAIPSWTSTIGNMTSNCYGILNVNPGGQKSGHIALQATSCANDEAEAVETLLKICNPKISGFYKMQNDTVDGFSEMEKIKDNPLPSDEDIDAQEKLESFEQFAIHLSNIANVFLLGAKIFVSLKTLSLAVITSTLDSLLDCLSGFILWFTAQSMRKASRYKYPIGSQRMQPLGIIVFASVMATLGFQILFESCRQLLAGTGSSQDPSAWPWLVGIMGGATVVKLGLYILCNSFSNEIVKAYALDHFFDVVTNSIGLAAALMGGEIAWWIDPVGAIVLAIYTMRLWSVTVWENVTSLTGESASPSFLQKLTYLSWNHHPKIKCIDTVRAYTFGTHYFCEVDIVLPPDMPLQEAHDIGESLQNKLECVPEIERAFVHLDYEYSHQPEHQKAFEKKP